jgi:hypothetical protein
MSDEVNRPLRSAASVWSARITAIGFVVLILGGNAWLVLGLVGGSIPDWLKFGAVLGGSFVLCGALGFGVGFLKRLWDDHKHLK